MNPVQLSDLVLSRSFGAAVRNCGRAAVVATLCMLLVEQPLLAEAVVRKSPGAAPQLAGQERVLHALNRLTFGPRPGDVAVVQAMGLNQWFEQQLHPATLDDSKLDAMLAEYPAMQLSPAELERKYPGPQMLKGMIEGRIQLPSDPEKRALVQDQMAFYKGAKARQEKAAAAGKPGDSGNMMAADSPMPVADATPEAARMLALPTDERMKAIMALPPAELVKLRQSLTPPQLARLTDGMTPAQKEMLVALPGSVRMIALESMESRVLRDIYSDRQLEAVMTDFWLNHFNVYVRKNQNEPYLLPTYERETIRAHALGNFEDLLVATAKSPAMLVYLDNFRSVGPDSPAASRVKQFQQRNPEAKAAQQASAGLNENYGRELMELHTLGVGGGYTQADVTNVAKVFTGWGLDRPYQGSEYRFEERRHEPGSKVVLGRTIGENGEKEGLAVLHMLATSPATAHFISQKLAVRFVSDDPPASLVNRMAASFLKSSGDIKTVLRTMFEAPEFWSPDVYRAKVKTPIEFVASAARASNLQVTNAAGLVQSLDKLGMPLYGMQTPNGYSWKQDEWVSTGALVSRMNFSLVLSANRLPGTRTSWTTLLGESQGGVMNASFHPEPGATPDTANPAALKEKRLEQMLLGQPVSERTRDTVLRQSTDDSVSEQAEAQFDLRPAGGKNQYMPRGAGSGRGPMQGPPDDAQAAVMAGLLLGSPEFQRR